MLFNETRKYNIQIFDKTNFLKVRTRQIKATESKLLILIVSVPLICLVLYLRKLVI